MTDNMKPKVKQDNEKNCKKRKPRKLFTHNEDTKLITLHEKYKDNWKKISDEMGNRSVRQCKERYNHYLSPNINKKEWTFEEDI